MSNAWRDNEPLLDLLIKQATEGLDVAESEQLATLLSDYPHLDANEMDAAVAAILLAADSNHERMPAALAERILAGAPAKSAVHASARVVAFPQRQPAGRAERAGWWAAAACFVLAVSGWWPRLVHEHSGTTHAAATPEQAREALLNSGHAIHAAWAPAGDAQKELVGDVVFDPVTQRGYLRFHGIPANDPRLEQYQLWIADASRKPPEPVDGGVFNAPQTTATGDVIIPFEAKLPVGKPAAFVVTVEQPGGVVVSKQERVLALAKVSGS